MYDYGAKDEQKELEQILLLSCMLVAIKGYGENV